VVGSVVQTFLGAIVNSGTISGSGGTAIDVSGANNAITIDQTGGLISGAIKLSAFADQLNISGGTIAGNIIGQGTDDITFALGSGTFTYGAAYSFTGINQVNVSSGTVILDGANQATNTTVTGGTLVIGDAADPGATLQTDTVAVNGGTLAGYGTIDAIGTLVTIASGATLAPGLAGGTIGTLTIAGSLTFAAGSFYDVAVNDTAASKTLVNGAPGTATINGGTVIVTPDYTTLGAHGGTTFAILTASSGRSGTFSGLTVNDSSFTGSFALSYDADDVFLDVGKGFELLPQPTGGTVNERNVANGINNAILAGDTVPAGFNQLLGLSGAGYLNALSQLSGQDATGAETSAFQLMTGFLDLMLDPFVSGRGYAPGGPGAGGGGAGGGAIGFAPDERENLPPEIAEAYAEVLKAPPANFNQRWSAWGTAYGGRSTAQGNAAVGSSTINASTYGVAGGMDYRVSPYTLLGFAMAGGGTGWGLANGLGSGYSEALQVGTYAISWFGPAYLSGALAFTNNWFTTNRAALGDQLQANFSGQSYGARLEGGYRVPVWATLGVTPYGALLAQDFSTPSYSETDKSGGGLGLSYAAMNATDLRTELGARFDDPTLFYGKPLILFGRLAWAHDFVSNPALSAAFEGLPGSSFTVYGAPLPHDSAITSAGAQYFLASNWSLIASSTGNFASRYQTYAGTGTLRYTW
jgi:uncharacterized protein with beta-barrel porin domain